MIFIVGTLRNTSNPLKLYETTLFPFSNIHQLIISFTRAESSLGLCWWSMNFKWMPWAQFSSLRTENVHTLYPLPNTITYFFFNSNLFIQKRNLHKTSKYSYSLYMIKTHLLTLWSGFHQGRLLLDAFNINYNKNKNKYANNLQMHQARWVSPQSPRHVRLLLRLTGDDHWATEEIA